MAAQLAPFDIIDLTTLARRIFRNSDVDVYYHDGNYYLNRGQSQGYYLGFSISTAARTLREME